VSLIARHLEAHGIASVVMGCARDIVEYVGVPRLVWSDFPLGNSAGKPHDAASQRATLALALQAFEATAPRTTLVSPQRWADDDAWQADYMNVARLDPVEVAARRAEHERNRRLAAQRKS
jgi:hypothetical protein